MAVLLVEMIGILECALPHGEKQYKVVNTVTRVEDLACVAELSHISGR